MQEESKHKRDWQAIAAQASVEMDSGKLQQLLQELEQALEEQHKSVGEC